MELNMNPHELDEKILDWLAEDIGSGDITTNFIVPSDKQARAVLLAKDNGVLAGLDVAARVFQLLDDSVVLTKKKKDGDTLTKGTIIAEIAGNARTILTGERLALNLLQHLSGVATSTAKLASIVAPFGAKLVDTRKTTPGLRLLDKYAVKVGGGANHRLGLYDAILIKDNHIAVAGGITEALKQAKANASHMTKIEIEVESLEQVKEALEAGADVIMLDNMSPEKMAEAVKIINHRAVVEASGGLTEETLAAAAASGVDILSVGALTHSVKALDISLDISLDIEL